MADKAVKQSTAEWIAERKGKINASYNASYLELMAIVTHLEKRRKNGS